MSSSASVYFVKTELEALASEIIAAQFEPQSANLLAYSGHNAPHLINPKAFQALLSLSYTKQKGFLSEKRSIHKNLEKLGIELRKLTPHPDNIYIHIPRLSTSKTNYAINYLIKKFPNSTVRVRLIPHGIVSVNLIPLTFSKRLKLLRRKYHPSNIVFPSLRYYPPRKDLVGGLDEIVDRVYTFKGISAPYPAGKVVELSGVRSYIQSTQQTKLARSPVVIGQPLLKNGLISEAAHNTVKQQIFDWLKENSFETIYYSKHPRSGDELDFFDNEYRLLQQDGAVEIALCEIQPEVVISCFSTALATAKTLFGDEIRAISFGLALTDSDKKEEVSKFFKSIDIELR